MDVWDQCVGHINGEITAAEFNTWILPLQALREGPVLRLFAPNKFVQDWAREHYEGRILELCGALSGGDVSGISFEVGGLENPPAKGGRRPVAAAKSANQIATRRVEANLNPEFTFDTFVEGNRTNWPVRHRSRSASIPAARTIRSSSMAAWAWGRPISCTLLGIWCWKLILTRASFTSIPSALSPR